MGMEQIIIERIRARMSELGTNATQVAAMAGLGKTAVRDILAGKVKTPSVETLARIADVLKCTVAYLIGEQEGPSKAILSDTSYFRPRMQPIAAELSAEWAVEPPEDKEEYLIYGTVTDPEAELRLYRVVDDHADELGIQEGDFVTAMVSAPLKTANLVDGILVVIRRLEGSVNGWEWGLREVESVDGKISLQRRSSKNPSSLIVSRIEGGDNMYLTGTGELVLVDGVVVRITREM